jgi:uncharacterized protein YndB with AHSA1/START domain
VTKPPSYTVRIERTFDAPAEAVFDAWTSPEVMRRWFHCEPIGRHRRPRSTSGSEGTSGW